MQTGDLWSRLRDSEVRAFPLATETNYTADGWQVDLVVVVEVTRGGHNAVPVMTYREPYAEGLSQEHRASPAEEARVTQAAVIFFADCLRRTLGGS